MKKRETIIFVTIFAIAIISTISFLKPHYSIDTIEFLTNGYESYIHGKFLVDGRIFSVILLRLVIDLPMEYVIPITYVIGILISCIGVMYMRKLIIDYDYKESKSNAIIIPTIIAYVIIFNFMYTDTFQFLEFPIIAVSVLLYIIAAKLVIEKKQNYIIESLIITTIAMFCYQGTMGILVITVFVLSIIKNKKVNKPLIVDIIGVVVILVATVGVNYLFTVWMGGTSRLSISIIENIKNTLVELYILIFNGGCQYPRFLQLILVIIICIWCAVNKCGLINSILIYVISITINGVLLLTVPNAFIGQYGRILFVMGATVGYMLMYLWCTSDKVKNSKFMQVLIYVYFITILITYSQYTYFYMKGQEIDREIATNISNAISKYEEDTGVKITKFSTKVKTSLWNTETFLNKKYFSQVSNYSIKTGRRTISIFNPTIIKLYTNREIEQVWFSDEVFEKLFENRNLEQNQSLNEGRFVFVGDTVYIWI